MQYNLDIKAFNCGVLTIAQGLHLPWIIAEDSLGDEEKLFCVSSFNDAESANLFLSSIASFAEDLLPQYSPELWVDNAEKVDFFALGNPVSFIGREYSIEEYQRDKYAGGDRIRVSLDNKTIAQVNAEISSILGRFFDNNFEWVSGKNSYSKGIDSPTSISYKDNIRAFVSPGSNEGYIVYLEGWGVLDNSDSLYEYDILTAKTFSVDAANTLASTLTRLVHSNCNSKVLKALNEAIEPSCPPLFKKDLASEEAKPAPIVSKQKDAHSALQEYFFGKGVYVSEVGSWCTDDERDYICVVYAQYDNDEETSKLSFHVTFDNSGKIDEAYALDVKSGNVIGNMRGGKPHAEAVSTFFDEPIDGVSSEAKAGIKP